MEPYRYTVIASLSPSLSRSCITYFFVLNLYVNDWLFFYLRPNPKIEPIPPPLAEAPATLAANNSPDECTTMVC